MINVIGASISLSILMCLAVHFFFKIFINKAIDKEIDEYTERTKNED